MPTAALARIFVHHPRRGGRLVVVALMICSLVSWHMTALAGPSHRSPTSDKPVVAATSTTPTAAFTLSATYGKLPLKVSFDAGGSKAAKGRSITKYAWDFGDGGKTTGVKTSHTFMTSKIRTVKLTVTDSKGASSSVTHTVDAGNLPPQPTMTYPSKTAIFSTGLQLTLAGSATDPQDGVLAASRLTWEVVYKHGAATTTLLKPTAGAAFKVTVPQPAEISTAATSTIVVTLTAKDSRGLTSTVSRTIKPKLTTVNIITNPVAASVRAGDVGVTGSGSIKTWVNSSVPLTAIGGIGSDGQSLAFSSWSDGGAALHLVTATSTVNTYTANFASVSADPFAPIADATVRDSQPTTNDGASTVLSARSSSPRERVYLKFNVGAASGTIVSAKIYLYALTTSTYTPWIYATSNDWTEAGLTWVSKPAPAGSPLPGGNGVSAGSWTTFDVTGAVGAAGTYSFVIQRDTKTLAQFVSREGGARAPRLVIERSGGGDPVVVKMPTNLAGEPFSANAIDLHWDGPSPADSITGYDIERDGALLTATAPVTSYRDLGLAPKTAYSYRIRAKTATGLSDWTAAVEITTPSITFDNVVTVKSATFVSEDPSVMDDYDSATLLRVQGGSNPSTETYLKFKLPALTGPAYRAELRVFIPASPASQPGGSISLYGSSKWDLGMTWSNRSGRHPVDPYDTVTNLPSGDWITLVPPDGALGNREISYVLATDSPALTFIARSGTLAPQLVIIALAGPVNVSAAPIATPTPTAAITPTVTSEPSPTPIETVAPVETETATATPTHAPEPTETATAVAPSATPTDPSAPELEASPPAVSAPPDA